MKMILPVNGNRIRKWIGEKNLWNQSIQIVKGVTKDLEDRIIDETEVQAKNKGQRIEKRHDEMSVRILETVRKRLKELTAIGTQVWNHPEIKRIIRIINMAKMQRNQELAIPKTPERLKDLVIRVQVMKKT